MARLRIATAMVNHAAPPKMDHVRFRDLRFYRHSAHIASVRMWAPAELSVTVCPCRVVICVLPRHGSNNTRVCRGWFRGVNEARLRLIWASGANTRLFNRHLRRASDPVAIPPGSSCLALLLARQR